MLGELRTTPPVASFDVALELFHYPFLLGEFIDQIHIKIVATQMLAACVVVFNIATPPSDAAAHLYSLYQH